MEDDGSLRFVELPPPTDDEVGPGNRQGLELLIRYTLRPALAASRLTRLPSGRIRYKLREP